MYPVAVPDDDMPMAYKPTQSWLIAGVDDSPHGATVAHVALVLGRQLDLKVLLVHAIGGSAARTELVGERRLDHIDAGRAVLDAITQEVDGGHELTTRLAFGGAADQLANLITELDAELVVIGSRGHGRLRAGLTGSVSRHLSLSASVPIVIVPPEVDSSWEFHSPLICGVDEEHSSDAAIRYAGALATRLGARLTLLNARTLSVTRVPDTATTVGYFIYEMAEVEEKASRELLRDRRRLAGPAAHVKLAFVEGRAARRLREAANHEHAGLLIVGSRRQGALRSFVAGSVSADLASHSRVPVMIVPPDGSSERAAA
jgi:nucleotide-binding universal stress UspA family protein